MIEAIMFFALGFLAASLIALVLLSAVWHRAVRLTTRRIEGAIPVSMAEIQADKDQLRAEFAMSTRRLEASVEQLKLKTTDQLAEIGRKTDVVRQLKSDVEETTAAVTSLEAQERALRDKLRATEEELSAKSRELHEAEGHLSSKLNELSQINRTLSEKSIEADSQRVEIVALETQCDTLKHRVVDLERDVAATEERLAEERGVVERTARTLAEEREKVENLTRRLADTERLVTEGRTVAENLSRNVASLESEIRRQTELVAERERELTGMRAEAAKYREETLASRRDAESAARAFNYDDRNAEIREIHARRRARPVARGPQPPAAGSRRLQASGRDRLGLRAGRERAAARAHQRHRRRGDAHDRNAGRPRLLDQSDFGQDADPGRPSAERRPRPRAGSGGDRADDRRRPPVARRPHPRAAEPLRARLTIALHPREFGNLGKSGPA